MRRITKHAAVAAAMALAAALGTPPAQAQNTHYGETFTLDSPLPSSQTHEYTASHHIDLLPGFHSEPGKNKWTSLQNDPNGIFPPDSCITGGPHPSDTGVVGAIAGTVDAGLMGAAVYSIPLELPEGINGMHPNLSVTYNSQSGNGLLGWGWDLQGLSWIERTGRTRYHDGTIGTVTLNDTTDRLALDGNRLIALMDYGDSVEYKTERDGMSRIRAYYAWPPTGQKGSSTSIRTISSFKVWRDDGKTLEYGGTDDSRMTLQDSGPKAFRWMLGRMTDRYGNSVVYHYSIHPNSGECYITSIEYTEHTYNGVVTIPPEFTVGFHYRPGNSKDGDVVYVAGNIVQDRKLLESVSINRNDPDTELARYRFRYRECVPSKDYDSVRMHERLDTIFLEREGMTVNPTIIDWSSYMDTIVVLNVTINDTAIYNNFPFVGDFNGDGLSDLAVVPHMDSVYTHNVDIRFFMNSPDNPGHFTPDPTLTLHGVDRRLDWLYPVDLNDDGLDDLVACFYDSIASEGRETMSVKVLENSGGTGFIRRDSIGSSDGCYIVRTGDFLGIGSQQLLLLHKTLIFFLPRVSWTLLYYDDNNLLKRAFGLSFHDLRDVAVGDFNGDGQTQVLCVNSLSSTVFSLRIQQDGVLALSQCFGTDAINHADGRWNHVFTGDFNGDGMTDLLYNDRDNNQSRWRVFCSTGSSFSASARLSYFYYYELPPFNLHSNSLRKVIDVMNLPDNWLGNVYSITTADFDGDGITDVAATRMTNFSSNIDIHFKYIHETNSFLYKFYSSTYNGSHFHNDSTYNYINCRSQYFHLGNFLGKENLGFLGLEYCFDSWPVKRRIPGVYSLKPSSELNSVSGIIDGMGNRVDLGYGYVRQPYRELGYGVRCLPVTVRVLKSVTTYNVSGYPMRERLGYADPCHHRDGHGWLGFGKRTRRLLENGEVVSSAVSHQSLETMSSHAMLLPVADTAFVFPNGTAVLSEATAYTFAKYLSSFGNLNPSRLVACPALEGKTTVRYDPDSPGTILSKTITESHYNHTDGYYYHTYRCDSTLTGVGDATAESAADCEFRSSEATVYYYDDHASWTLNRPHSKVWVRSRTGKPDVERCRWYEYVSTTSLLPSCVYDIPNRVPDQNPLMIQTNFDYHQDGNLSSKTVIAPHGQFGEQRRAIAYEYGPGNRHRLVTNETTITGDLSYTTSYSYDDHDRIDTLTPPNGLETAYQSDAFGATSWTSGADGTRSCVARRWADGHPLAPAGATYYTWDRSSDGVQTLSFLHKTGVELRSVAFDIHGEPVITDKRYDGRGRLMAVSEPYKAGETVRWTLYGYDALDRPTSVTTPDTTCVATSYEGLRTETAVTSPSGQTRVTAVTVNAMGWTVRCDDAVGSHVVYDHYADGLMAAATVNDDPATTVSATYDAARNRSSLIDPDYGTLATVYDAYGRLVRSTSPREQAAQAATTLSYDGMDRLVSVADGMEGTLTTYSYNETDTLKGTLAGIRLQRQGGADIQRLTYGYDTLARPVSVTEQRAGGSYTTVMSYDNLSRVDRVVHSTGVAVRYGYLRGQLWTVSDDNGRTLWKTKGTDAFGNVVEAELGNGASTQYAFDTVTHRLRGIVTTKNLQNLAYGYDKFGNLAARKDNTTRMEETFTYDNMNRLTGIDLTRSAGQGMHCTVAYDALGRMTSRQAVTSTGGVPQVETVFSNPSFDPVKLHAMTHAQTSAPAFPSTNLDIAYTSFDKVSRIRQGGDSLRYSYGFDRQRMRVEEFSTGWSRTKDYVGRCEFVTESGASGTYSRSLTFVTGPCGVFAVVEDDGQTQSVHYVLKDNLGSWSVVTDGDGNVEQRLSFDAWGNPRDPSTWVNHLASGGFGKPMFDRGFTGHEYLPLFGLVNMNGRVYDPATASFLSPDRYMQDPTSAQGFNRYAYCMNNPLRYVDPSGWKPRQPIVGSTPTSADYFRDIYAYAEKAYEPGDFRNAYYMYNMAFYGNMGGPGGGNAYGGSYFNSYGYYASRCYNSVYNYTSPIALLQDWQNNPSYSTNKSLIEAGIDNITVGELYGSYFGNPGYRNSYYTWTDSDGNIRTAEVLFEHVGGFSNGVFTVSNQPLWMYESRSLSEKVNIIAQSLGVPLGTIENGMECAAKAYYNVPMVKVRSGLTNAQKIAAISKEGLMLSKVTKGLGVAGAAVSTFINGYQTYNYYNNGGTGYDVLVKGLFDVGMVTLGVFGGPIGLGISLGYMVVDLATDGFHVSYEIKP